MISITFTFYNVNRKPDDYSKLFNAIYMSLIRAGFIIGLILFIFPILLGRGQVLRAIMGHEWMTPLARVSFGMYLIHPTYMLFESFNRQRATWVNHNSNILAAFGWWSVTVITSFLFTIIIETPCANLEKTFLMGGNGRNSKPKEKTVKVPVESFENSFSKGMVTKGMDEFNEDTEDSIDIKMDKNKSGTKNKKGTSIKYKIN